MSKLSSSLKTGLDIIRFIEFGNLERELDVPKYNLPDLDIKGFPPLTIPPCNCIDTLFFRKIILPNNGKKYTLEIVNKKGDIVYKEKLNNFKNKNKKQEYRIHTSSLKIKPINKATIRLISKGKKNAYIEINKIDLIK